MELGAETDLKFVDIEALGTSFSVACSDVGPENGPVIMLLHGSPATYRTFRKLFHTLTEKGFRLIMPNFPGMGYTELDKKGIYNFSAHHKAEIIKALIKAMGVNRVETLGGFSSGGHVIARVVADQEFHSIIKSLTFLSVPGGRPYTLVRPLFLIKFLGNLVFWSINIPIIGWLLTLLFKPIFRLIDLRGKTDKATMYSVFEGAQLDFEQCKDDYVSISKRKLPFLMMHAEDDPSVEMELATENMEILGVNADNAIRYDRHGEFTEKFVGKGRKLVIRMLVKHYKAVLLDF